MNNAKPERHQNIAVRCFMSLLRWLRVVLFQDAVFLRRKYPALKIWLEPAFNDAMFNNFAEELLHEAEHGETPQYVRVNRAMPDLAHQLREQHDNVMNTMFTHHQSVLMKNKQEHVAASINNKQEHTLTRNTIIHNLKPILSVLTSLSNPGRTVHTQTSSDTRVQLTADSSHIANIATGTSLFNSNLVAATNSLSRPLVNEESTTLNSIAESASERNSVEQYRLATHVKTVMNL